MSQSLDALAIYEGVRARFLAQPALVALVSGMSFNQPLEGAAYPLIIYRHLGNTPWDHLKGGTSRAAGEEIFLQLSILSQKYPDASEALTILAALTDAYDESNITIAGYTTQRMERVSYELIEQAEAAIVHIAVRYKLTVQKT